MFKSNNGIICIIIRCTGIVNVIDILLKLMQNITELMSLHTVLPTDMFSLCMNSVGIE